MFNTIKSKGTAALNALKKVGSTTIKYEKAPVKKVESYTPSTKNVEYGNAMNKALSKAKNIGVGVGGN